MRKIGVVLCTAAVTFGLAALSRAPWSPPGADEARLRMSWRMDVTVRENCRTRTSDELASLPVHMRTPEVCTPVEASYALVTSLNGAPPDTLALTRGGVKGDRPLFVLQERVLEPGRHAIEMTLERHTASGSEVLAMLDERLTMRKGEVQLVTLDAAGRLVVRSPDVQPSDR